MRYHYYGNFCWTCHKIFSIYFYSFLKVNNEIAEENNWGKSDDVGVEQFTSKELMKKKSRNCENEGIRWRKENNDKDSWKRNSIGDQLNEENASWFQIFYLFYMLEDDPFS